MLKFEGKEKTWFRKKHQKLVWRTRQSYDADTGGHTEYYQDVEYYDLDHEGAHEFIDLELPLMEFPDRILATGQYSFPFTI